MFQVKFGALNLLFPRYTLGWPPPFYLVTAPPVDPPVGLIPCVSQDLSASMISLHITNGALLWPPNAEFRLRLRVDDKFDKMLEETPQ